MAVKAHYRCTACKIHAKLGDYGYYEILPRHAERKGGEDGAAENRRHAQREDGAYTSVHTSTAGAMG